MDAKLGYNGSPCRFGIANPVHFVRNGRAVNRFLPLRIVRLNDGCPDPKQQLRTS
jgi:hypothetical protein